MRVRVVYFATGGLLMGILLAGATEHWRQTALAKTSAAGAEGVWWDGLAWTIVAGFPVNGVLALLLEPVAAVTVALGIDPFYALLLGIVVNWCLIGSLIGKLVQRAVSQ